MTVRRHHVGERGDDGTYIYSGVLLCGCNVATCMCGHVWVMCWFSSCCMHDFLLPRKLHPPKNPSETKWQPRRWPCRSTRRRRSRAATSRGWSPQCDGRRRKPRPSKKSSPLCGRPRCCHRQRGGAPQSLTITTWMAPGASASTRWSLACARSAWTPRPRSFAPSSMQPTRMAPGPSTGRSLRTLWRASRC